MNNVICVVKGQRTKCEVCQHPAITFNRTEAGGRLDVSGDAYTQSRMCAYSYTRTPLHMQICLIILYVSDQGPLSLTLIA